MKASHHVALSAVFSGLLLAAFRSWPLALASLGAGILMDADHMLDYLLEYGLPFDVRRFFRASYQREYRRVFILLHAWEWLPALVLLAWLAHNPWITGFALGWTQHMIADQACNRPRAWAYFLVGRWRRRFDHQVLFPPRRPVPPPAEPIPPSAPRR